MTVHRVNDNGNSWRRHSGGNGDEVEERATGFKYAAALSPGVTSCVRPTSTTVSLHDAPCHVGWTFVCLDDFTFKLSHKIVDNFCGHFFPRPLRSDLTFPCLKLE